MKYTDVFLCLSIGYLSTTSFYLSGASAATKSFKTNVDAFGNPLVKTQYSKYDVPENAALSGKATQFSLTRSLDTLSHPGGSELFGGNECGPLLDIFLSAIDKSKGKVEERFKTRIDSYFIVYFTRLQITIIQALYQHLLSVYTNFLLTPVNTEKKFKQYQQDYAFNTKMLVVQYLLSIIEEHASNAVRYRFPALPSFVASRLGPLILRNDYGADLYTLLERQYAAGYTFVGDANFFDERRGLYLEIFGKYLKLFQAYGSQVDSPQGISMIQKIVTFFNERYSIDKISVSGQPPQIMKQLGSVSTLNPPLFLHAQETIKNVDILLSLAKGLPQNSRQIDWPSLVVADAQKKTPIKDAFGNVMSNLPRAYFVGTAKQTKLFVNIPRIDGVYAQELKKEPLWLNSPQGIVAFLRACLGDYSMIFGDFMNEEEILDPCTGSILIMAGIIANTIDTSYKTKAQLFGQDLQKSNELTRSISFAINTRNNIPQQSVST